MCVRLQSKPSASADVSLRHVPAAAGAGRAHPLRPSRVALRIKPKDFTLQDMTVRTNS
jgi:hypothetical protein